MILLFQKIRNRTTPYYACFLVLLSTACSPSGDLQRHIHPPHKAFLANKNAGDSSPPPPGGLRRGRPGIPTFCQASRPTNKFLCITCSSEELHIQRCAPYSGAFDPDKNCMSSRDHIKCLMQEGPTGLVISLKRPCEKLLRENYTLWEDAVWSIWESKLEQSDYDELSGLLRFLKESSYWLSQKPIQQIEDFEIIANLPFSAQQNTQQLKAARASLSRLEKLKWKGKLNLELFLQEWKSFFQEAGLDSELLKILDAMSLEGLEEQEPSPIQR